MTDELTKDQQIMQLKIAVEMLEVDHTKLKEVDRMLEIILHNLIENRTEVLHQNEPTIEEILIQESRAKLMEITG